MSSRGLTTVSCITPCPEIPQSSCGTTLKVTGFPLSWK
ncbi:hypothetical protein APHACPA_1291 [Rickettsia amblyommatis str. Ac/Pa]|uniref:Uncharacterized protein n=1 Tax=Rickettsia amblyommatis str. Ac/Pa TaxID=1359164 RepID=A0A0F3N2H0_RICAM|nr:hypothetical protein APHACPA_1291 [Rickettsia amblyommatis str. Ac/Pa]